MQRLSWVRIVNFRSCVDATFNLADFTPLVGCNNAGKSGDVHRPPHHAFRAGASRAVLPASCR